METRPDDVTSRLIERAKNRRRLSSKIVKSPSPPSSAAARPKPESPRHGNDGASADGSATSRSRLEERSAGDGVSDDEEHEVEELSRLRCPSVATEVVAAEEQRRRERQRRRCSDYPGLSFGSSIFSSDTIMKLNIIKNELHNILNSQLKRVSFMENMIIYIAE